MVDLFDYLDRTCNQANSTDLEEIIETADIKELWIILICQKKG